MGGYISVSPSPNPQAFSPGQHLRLVEGLGPFAQLPTNYVETEVSTGWVGRSRKPEIRLRSFTVPLSGCIMRSTALAIYLAVSGTESPEIWAARAVYIHGDGPSLCRVDFDISHTRPEFRALDLSAESTMRQYHRLQERADLAMSLRRRAAGHHCP